MEHRGSDVAVDTSKFESWPLLRPDEIPSLPTEVLRASVADLDTMCQHTSGDDPVAGYARIQRERTSAILSGRAAQARVQALLAGTAFVGRERLETAPSHDDAWSAHQPVSSNPPGDVGGECSANEAHPAAPEPTPPSECGDMRRKEEAREGSSQDVRSPPRLQPSTFGPPVVSTAAVAPITTTAGAETIQECSIASSLGKEKHQYQTQVRGDYEQAEDRALGEDGRVAHGRQPRPEQPAVRTSLFRGDDSSGLFRDQGFGQASPKTSQASDGPAAAAGAAAELITPREPNRFCGVLNKVSNSSANVNVTSPLPSHGTTGARHQHHNTNQRGGGRAAPRSAVRDNWGSVFVVGGGRRRRRPPVRQRSSEAEDTPAARRSQVDKERQERRTASLRRLMLRKEQRALQQEARRRRRAAAARKAAAAAAAAAAAPPAPAPAPPPSALAPAPDLEAAAPAPAGASRVGRGARESVDGAEGGEGKPFVGSQQSRTDGIGVGSRNPDGPSELIVARKERRSSSSGNASVDPEAGSPLVSNESSATYHRAPTMGVSGTASNTNEGGNARGEAVSMTMMSSTGFKQSGIGVGSSLGRSSGSESESVSGGDSSDDDDLLIDEIDEDGGVTPKGGVNSDFTGKPTDQAKAEEGLAKDALVQQEARRASAGMDKSYLRHASDSDVKGGEVAGDGNGRAEGSPDKRHQQQEQQSSALQEAPNSQNSTKISSSGIPVGLAVSGGGGGGGDVVAGDDVGAANKLVAGAAAGAAVDAAVTAVDGSAAPESDDSDSGSEMEWEEGKGNNGATKRIDGRGGGGAGGGNATELPGPLDVQPVIGVEVELGQVSISNTTKRRSTGLLPSDPNSPPLAATNGDMQQSKMLRPAPALSSSSSSSPRSSVPLTTRHPRSAAGNPNDSDNAAVRVLGVLGEVWQEAKAVPRSPSKVATTLSKDGTHGGLNLTPRDSRAGQAAVPIVMSLSLSLSEESCAKQEAGEATSRAETEATTDSEPVAAGWPARYPRAKPAYHTAERVSDVDSYTKGNKNSTAALTPPRQHQELPIASPRARERINNSSGLPQPNLQAGSGNAEKRGHGSFTASCKQPDGVTSKSSDRALTRYSDCYSRFAAVLTAHHNGRALTRQADCRSLPLTSSIMSAGRNGRAAGCEGSRSGLTVAEEEACLRWQWKLYSIHVRVIKDYAAVFSYGDGWSVNPSTDDSNSLVYSGDASALHYRVNSKARPEVYNIVTDVLNNRCEQWEELPTGLGLKTTWNLLWTWSKPHIQYSSLLTWQKVNHFPNSRELTRKDLLNKHISRFMALGGRLAREFHIMPQTFVLPHEFTLFVSAFTASGRSRRGGRGSVDAAWGGSRDEDDTAGASENDGDWKSGQSRGSTRGGKEKNLWIMKPVGMSRGRGIRLIDDIKNISYADKVVLQRYVGNPLLLDGYKFDLRLYVLVTSFNKLEAFIYKEGFARLSTHRYEKGDIENRFIHLTNSSIQRLNETGAAQDSPLHHAKISEAGGTKTTLSYLWRRLAASGVDVGALWAGICSVVVKSLVCVEVSIPNQPNSFELFGYDVLIDDRLRPWLIEVNSSPSMARDTHVDRQVKEALIFETVHLVDPLPFDRKKLVDVLGRRLSANDNSKARPFKQHHHQPHHQQQQHGPPSETSGNAQEGGTDSTSGQPPTATGDQTHRPRRCKEEGELDRDLDGILCGRRPRRVGEPPARMGNFVRLCPGTAAHRRARRLRRRVIRPQPGDDDEPAAKP